jgi:hypothetical protein
MTKIKMKSIRIYGSESSYAGDKTFDSWFEAGLQVKRIANHAPRGGGYDKTKFEVTFEDGHIYRGRLDIQHYTMPYPDNDNDLAKHIYNHLRFYAGQWCPPHLTEEDYQGILAGTPESGQKYLDFLATYEIPTSDGLLPGQLVYCVNCWQPYTKNESVLCGRCLAESEEKDQLRAEREAARKAKEADPLYPTLKAGRTEVTKKMRQLLRERSGKAWSVKGGRGTGWGWLTIAAPPSRMDNWRMTPEDQAELATLLGQERVHCQGESVSSDSWWHYLKACRGDFSEEVTA